MYTCSSCGNSSTTKLGKCPMCGSFGTFIVDNHISSLGSKKRKKSGQILSTSSKTSNYVYYTIAHRELNRVFGQGVKQSGVYLLAGEPGIGKSTIMLQMIHEIITSNPDAQIAYFSAEEHPSHIYERRERIMGDASSKPSATFEVFHTSTIEDIVATTNDHHFDMIVIDSIQTVHSGHVDSPAGSPNQVRQASEQLTALAKTSQVTTFIIGHVTKGGEIAGPKYLEHIVDVVMYLEGDKDGQLRFLRTKKNRFGPTDDVGIFEMTLFGLQPVYNLQDRILQQITTTTPGSVLSLALDNGRPVLVQVEALLNKTAGKYPIRRCIGVDHKRVDMILAILSKYMKIDTSFTDVFINVPGETLYVDSGLDLAIALAVLSQYKNFSVEKTLIVLGEITLSGQVKKTKQHERRAKEVSKGFSLVDYQMIKHIVELPAAVH